MKIKFFRFFIFLILIDGVSFAGTIPFITTWETTTINETIRIPTTGGGYNYTIDWGDGNITIGEIGDAAHVYDVAGTYFVSITGDFPRINFNAPFNGTTTLEQITNARKIQKIEQWGDNVWTSMETAFAGCSNLNITNESIDKPDLSSVTRMRAMFIEATSFNGNISNWDVSSVINMTSMFANASLFNQDIGNWNVSNVTNMFGMFTGADSFNQDLTDWNVSNVTSMTLMFSGATSFNGDITNWNVSNVTSMSSIFSGATSFNGDIIDWNVSSVESMSQMFQDAISFNQDLTDWNVSNVENMTSLFQRATSFNGDIIDWNVSNVGSMSQMFQGATSFDQDIGAWNVSNVEEMDDMFSQAELFNQDIGAWNVENVLDAKDMFDGITLSIMNYDALLIGWNAQNLKPNVDFSGGNSQYCEGEISRDNISISDNWTIIDGGKVISPIVDDFINQDLLNEFIFPIITGTDLTGSEAYYSEPGGEGVKYEAGDVINFDPIEDYPLVLYIYDGLGSCSSEEDFLLTINTICIPPIADVLVDVEACVSYTLPALSPNNFYYTGPSATGDLLEVGDDILSTQSVYIYAGNSICNDESSFEIIIVETPIPDVLVDVEACVSYTLPVLSPNNFYYTGPSATGDLLEVGDDILSTQTVYIYAEILECSNESSFIIVIDNAICDNVKTDFFPEFFSPNGDGTNDTVKVNQALINNRGKVYIFDRFGKLLKQFDAQIGEWNGTFLGKEMPSDDYWYSIEFIDGKIINGHFTLIR